MKHFSIYQLDKNCEGYHHKLFTPIEWLDEKPSIKDYNKVYEGDLEGNPTNLQACEDIFVLFNVHRPEDFKGHSLSVSDIIEFGGEYYYCDRYGFQKI